MNNNNLILPEGLIWDKFTSKFMFVDIKLCSIFQIDLKPSFRVNKLFSFDESIGFAYPINNDEILCGMKSGLAIFNRVNKKSFYICKINKKNFRINDGFIDENNIVWFGLMHENDSSISDKNNGLLYSYSLNKKHLNIEDKDYLIPNGPVISKDKNWLFHSDSFKGIIYRYKYSQQFLDLTAKEVFFDCNKFSKLNPSPDGMTIDDEGNLVVAVWGIGEVWVISTETERKILNRIKIPGENVTNVCFSMNDNTNLFVTYAASKSTNGNIHIESNYGT